MKDRFTKFICFILTAALLAGCSAGAGAAVDDRSVQTAAMYTPQPSATPESSPAATAAPGSAAPADIHADVDYDDMTWELYDMSRFRALTEAMETVSSGAEAAELYGQLMEEYELLRTYSELAWIEFYAVSGEDEELSDACQQLDDCQVEAWDAMLSALSAALNGPAREELSALLGEETTRDLDEYEPMTEREAELSARETELELEYEREMDPYVDSAAQNRKLGAIFLELVEVRNELAELHGYDSYADYAYESIYGRDFTPEDAAALCRAIKPYAREYFRDCYDTSIHVTFYDRSLTSFSAGQLTDFLEEYAPRISTGAAEAQAYMDTHGLHSINYSTSVSFTTYLPTYNAPFLFISMDGSVYDLQTAFHEFGHYCDAYLNPEPEGLSDYGSYDIFEIHSTGLEALLCSWYDEIYPGHGDEARITGLDSLMYNVITGCIYDEFLQYVYAHPGMSVGEVNDAFRDIAASYGAPMDSSESRFYWDSYDWMNVNHNFSSPFYYISYAVSTLASLQIWTLAQTDLDAAIALYNDIVAIGAYTVGYGELLQQVGLVHFLDDPEACISQPLEALRELCRQYEEGESTPQANEKGAAA